MLIRAAMTAATPCQMIACVTLAKSWNSWDVSFPLRPMPHPFSNTGSHSAARCDQRMLPNDRQSPDPGASKVQTNAVPWDSPEAGALEELIARAEKMEGDFEERTRGARAAQRDEGRQGTPRAPADRGHAGQVREARPRVPLGVGGREASPRPLTGAGPSPGNRPAPAEDRLLVTAHAASRLAVVATLTACRQGAASQPATSAPASCFTGH